ncbi:MAG: hypothetical protein O7H41_13310 [Planctomycetota bacterium]|nr:hypothetical protein [Planctomycetota bacterium]
MTLYPAIVLGLFATTGNIRAAADEPSKKAEEDNLFEPNDEPESFHSNLDDEGAGSAASELF